MTLALFDLDNTLLAGDSDFLWGQFLVDKGLVDKDRYEAANQRFYDEYKRGTLDIYEFLAFSLQPLTQFPREQLDELHREFMQRHIHELMTDKGRHKIREHRNRGDDVVIITATNSFVTRPIAEAFGADQLIATEPEMINGRYTGKVAGTPCFKEGKITRLQQWLKTTHHDLKGSTFYSDSHNDLPLLEITENPVAVDPDEQLRQVAENKGWPVISFR